MRERKKFKFREIKTEWEEKKKLAPDTLPMCVSIAELVHYA